MSDPDDISHLDFDAEIRCEIFGHPYLMTREFFGREIPVLMGGIPRSARCTNTSSTIVSWRLCPCWGDIRQWVEANQTDASKGRLPTVVGGLVVRPFAVCDDHLRYFFEYIRYPHVCSGCGVTFLHPREMILDGADLDDDEDDQ